MSGPRIRRARAADAARVGAVVQAAYAPWVPRLGVRPLPMDLDYEEVIATRRAFVAEPEEGGPIVGLLVLGSDEEGFFIDNVAVDPAAQGAGTGRALLEHAEHEARSGGFDAIYLWTHELMSENLAIYSARGYREYDRRSPRPGAPPFLVYMRKPLP